MASIVKNKKILAIIPARGGSKRIPRKNVRILLGRPLITYTIEAAQKSKYINRVVVSTEDKEITLISEKLGAEVIKRPTKLAGDESESIDVLLHTLDFLEKDNYIPDICVFLQPTSPLRDEKDIDKATQIFLEGECDSVVSVKKSHYSAHWLFEEKNSCLSPVFGKEALSKSVCDLPDFYIPNGAIFVFSPFKIKKNRDFFPKRTIPYIMESERSVDIDEESDFKLAEQILKDEKHKNKNR